MAPDTKKNKEILLISVQNNLSIIGFKYIHYSLLENGWQSKFLYLPYLDMNDVHKLNKLKDFISEAPPIFIGLSLTSIEYYRARDLSIYLKKTFPEIPVIWGGVHPTIDPGSCFPYADYVCIGEGEQSLLDFSNALVRGEGMNEVHNICFQENGALKKNPLYPPLENLDGLPRIDHITKQSYIQRANGGICLIDKHIYAKEARFQGKMYETISSRGCPYSCTYCCNNFFVKLYETRKIRRRSVENIIGELEQAVRNNPEIDTILFKDDSLLSCSMGYFTDFCQAYKTRIKKPLVISATPTAINPDKLRLLKEIGISLLNIGLQSGSDRVNKEIYKRTAMKKDFLHSAKLIKEFNIAGKYDVILDNPFEDEDDIIETIEALIETPKPYIVEFFSLSLYPGTELHNKVLRECPETMEDCRAKNYIQYKKTTLNRLIVLAVYLPEVIMKKLLALYKKDSDDALSFKTVFFVSRLLSSIYYKPKTLVGVLKLSRDNSYIKALRVIPMYVKNFLNYRNV